MVTRGRAQKKTDCNIPLTCQYTANLSLHKEPSGLANRAVCEDVLRAKPPINMHVQMTQASQRNPRKSSYPLPTKNSFESTQRVTHGTERAQTPMAAYHRPAPGQAGGILAKSAVREAIRAKPPILHKNFELYLLQGEVS